VVIPMTLRTETYELDDATFINRTTNMLDPSAKEAPASSAFWYLAR
jgi:hypothetical protein